MALEIQVLDGKKVLAKQVFDQNKIIVGRILSADLKIADPRVSRIHALLERLDDGGLRLTDLASTHGTFVNGERIIERMVGLSDEIAISSLKLKLTHVKADKVERPEMAKTPSPAAATPRTPPKLVATEVQVQSGGQAVSVSRESTQIRSLKDIARTRGVLESVGLSEELEVTVYWQDTILAIDHYGERGATVTIGEAATNTYVVPGELPPRFDFVKVRGQSAEIYLHPSMKGSVRVQGKMETLEALQKSGRSNVVVSGHDIAKIQIGTVNFFLMFVAEPPEIPRSSFLDQGRLFWAIQVSVACLAALFVALGFLFQAPIEGQVKEFPEKYRKIIVEEFKKKEEKREDARKVVGLVAQKGTAQPDAPKVSTTAKAGGNEGEGARERGAEGKRGKPNAAHETGITNRPKTSASRKVHDAPVRARNDGILSALKTSGLGTKLAKVSGVDGGATGNDPLKKALSGVGGGGVRDGRGAGGSGLQGTGPGGGGTAVGVGGLGTKGFGGGAKGNGVGSIPGKGDFAVGTESGSVTVLGSLSREEIERVVNAHRNEVQFCYQKELSRDPRLYGKVKLKWIIGGGGRVTSASSLENSTGSQNLQDCILSKVKGWAFPTPTGGSTATVEWPWIFKPQGT